MAICVLLSTFFSFFLFIRAMCWFSIYQTIFSFEYNIREKFNSENNFIYIDCNFSINHNPYTHKKSDERELFHHLTINYSLLCISPKRNGPASFIHSPIVHRHNYSGIFPLPMHCYVIQNKMWRFRGNCAIVFIEPETCWKNHINNNKNDTNN